MEKEIKMKNCEGEEEKSGAERSNGVEGRAGCV